MNEILLTAGSEAWGGKCRYSGNVPGTRAAEVPGRMLQARRLLQKDKTGEGSDRVPVQKMEREDKHQFSLVLSNFPNLKFNFFVII